MLHSGPPFDAIVGGNPGSWGVVTEFEMEAIPSADYPNTEILGIVWTYSLEVARTVSLQFAEMTRDPEFFTSEELNWRRLFGMKRAPP